MGFAIRGYVIEPPRIGSSNSPFTSGPNNFVPQTLLAGTFTVTTGSAVVLTTADLTSVLSAGDTIVFLVQVGVVYTIASVAASQLVLTAVFSGVFSDTTTPGVAAYSPDVGPDVEAYNTAYPSSEANPRDDYCVLVTSELAPSIGTSYTITQVQQYQTSGLIQITSSAPVANGQTVIISGTTGVPEAEGQYTVTVIDSTDFILNGSSWSGGLYTGGGSVLVIQGQPGLLTCAGFGWTKNEIVARFDYDARNGRFRPLPGGALYQAGVLSSTGGTPSPGGGVAQLMVPAPDEFLVAAPFRLSIGSLGAGITCIVDLVLIDADFTNPPHTTPNPTVQLSLATGNLNWNQTDLNNFNNQTVQFQQQQFFPIATSTGDIGTVSTSATAPYILLNPIPGQGTVPPGTFHVRNGNTAVTATQSQSLVLFPGATVLFSNDSNFTYTVASLDSTGMTITLSSPFQGSTNSSVTAAQYQFPLIRFGYLYWLQTVAVPSELHFTPSPGPPPGTVEWAIDTGVLNFNSTPVTGDLFTYNGTIVYYDGVLYARDLLLPRQSLGPMTSGPMGPINTPVPATGDIIFSVPSNALKGTPYYQFPYYDIVGFNAGLPSNGTVDIEQRSGFVQFSSGDAGTYSGQDVTVVFGDLPIDHGVSIRFFRCLVNLNGQTAGVKDVTAVYSVQNAVWQAPLMASPLVFIPATPIDDETLVITVGQGTGTFTGTLNPLAGPSPIPGLGYYIDFDTRQLNIAKRFENELDLIVMPSGFVQLQNPLVLTSNIVLALETGAGTDVFMPLTVGVDCLVDGMAGLVYFISTFGVDIDNGSAGTFSGTVFTDPTANFITAGVQAGNYLLILTDTHGQPNAANTMYTITSVASASELTVDATPPPSGTLFYQILTGKEVMADRFFQTITLTDPTTSVQRITALGTIQNETPVAPTSNATFPNLTTLSDSTANFTTDGVLPGDTINLPATATTQWFLVQTSTQTTLTPTASFTSANDSTYSVTRRLQIPINYIGSVSFRYGSPTTANPTGVFSTAVNVVANDGLFTSPAILPQGTVEVSRATGNLNFSSVDVANGGTVFMARSLAVNTDYKTQPQLGLVQFTSRLLTGEEVLMTYVQAPPSTTPPTSPVTFTNERGTFLVRKELALPHPTPTSTLFFNPTGKSVATNPPSRVFRGGRPQVTNTQVVINPGNPPTVPSSMTFLPDNILTDALPHGAIIGPTENVYIDYYVYQAMGGEQTLTVLNPPLLVAVVNITDGTTSFTIAANQTANFPSGFLMVVNSNEVYLIGTVTYDPVADQTTVNLGQTLTVVNVLNNGGLVQVTTSTPHGLTTGQQVSIAGVLGVPGATVTTNLVTVVDSTNFTLNSSIFTGSYGGGGIVTVGSQLFQSDQSNPPLLVASGPTPLVSALLAPAYFSMELAPYLTVARGVNTLNIPNDKTSIYQTNTIVYVTDGINSFTDFYLVTSSQYNQATNLTVVTLATTAVRQYTFGKQLIFWSVRSIYGQAPSVVATSRIPITTPQSEPVTVIRRIAGQPGKILSTPTGYSIDSSGNVTYTSPPLQPDEEFSIFYTGYRTVAAGPRLQATYTATIVPDSTTNGLLGQILNANFTLFSPDNFYYRVETMTNFKLQVSQEIQSSAQSQSSPIGSGPMTSNTSAPVLYQQGQPSVWFPPGNYANHDLIAQAALLYFNNAINDLEDVLHDFDGRIVGDVDGRFQFDAVIGRYDYFSYDYNVPPTYPWLPVAPLPPLVPNQIDDLIQIRPGPLPSYPSYLSYFQQAYVTGPLSRFYKTRRNVFVTDPVVVAPGQADGSVIGQLNFTNLTSTGGRAFKRAPRAQTLFDYPLGTSSFLVDNTVGDGTLRPSWTVSNPPSSIIGMYVVVLDTQGNYYIDESDNATVVAVSAPTSVSPGSITISGIPHEPAGPGGTPPSPPVNGPSTYAGGASVLTFTGPPDNIVTIAVGINGISPRAVGTQSLTLSGAASSGNNGTFPIVGVNTQLGEIMVTNAAAVPEDLNNGSITWQGSYLSFVPVGTTITVSPIDVCVAQQQAQDVDSSANGTYGMSYTIGNDDDVSFDTTSGNVLYESPFWPVNGNSTFKLPTLFIPESDYIIPVNNGDIIEIDGVGVAVTYTAPYQFPALFGMALDDDGNQSVPIIGPTFDGEMTEAGGGALNLETSFEAPGSAFTTQIVTLPFMSTGALSNSGTRITLDPTGIFPTSPTSLGGPST